MADAQVALRALITKNKQRLEDLKKVPHDLDRFPDGYYDLMADAMWLETISKALEKK